MTPDKRASEPQAAAEKRRRSWRGAVLVPIAVQWEEPGGKGRKAEAQAKEVNMHGGLLQFSQTDVFPAAGTEMKLTNLFSGAEARARTSGIRRSKGGAMLGVAVELLIPSETFWGLAFRLRKATAELQSLDQEIKDGNVDLSVLREFRDSVDYVRTTAWAVQEWQERQAQRRDTCSSPKSRPGRTQPDSPSRAQEDETRIEPVVFADVMILSPGNLLMSPEDEHIYRDKVQACGFRAKQLG